MSWKFAELEVRILRLGRREATQGAALRVWLEDRVLTALAGRILAVNTAVAMRAAQLQVPNSHPVQHGLIAATAWVPGMTMATRNTSDFQPTGVSLLNPWHASLRSLLNNAHFAGDLLRLPISPGWDLVGIGGYGPIEGFAAMFGMPFRPSGPSSG